MRIFFLASDNPKPSGGLKFIYRFCEMARELGYDAAVMHGQAGFRVDNFNHSAPVAYNFGWKKRSRRNLLRDSVDVLAARLLGNANEIEVGPEDIVVLPENRLFRAHEIFPQTRKILLCQAPFLAARQGAPHSEANIVGSICISQACSDVVNRILPGMPQFRVPLWLETDLFLSSHKKAKSIVYMPRRNADEARIVLNLLSASKIGADFDFYPLDDVPIRRVAQVLRDSLMFLSFADREGFGLPAAEAIASGCLTIGYTGIGGNEFFQKFGGWPVPQQDVIRYVDTIADVIDRYSKNPEEMDDARMQNAEAIVAHYNREASCTALAQALKALI